MTTRSTWLGGLALAALAVVLIVVGVKLSPPSLWRSMWRAGATQFTPFVATVLAVLGTDLLKGTLVGLAVGGVLATAPSAAYLAGLGILWAAPAAGALVGMEWGRGDSPPPGALVLRF